MFIYLRTAYTLQVHPTHNLPNGYNFTNFNNGFLVNAVRPIDISEEVDGPVHRNQHSCSNSTYYFMVR